MKFELFSKLFDEAKEYSNADMYVAERGWQDWMDDYSDNNDATTISDILFNIYDLAHMGIKELRAHERITFKTFSFRYSIPSRTVQDWEYGNNKTPEYILKLISYTILQNKLESKYNE